MGIADLAVQITADISDFVSKMGEIGSTVQDAGSSLSGDLTSGAQDAQSALDSLKDTATNVVEALGVLEAIHIGKEIVSSALEAGEGLHQLSIKTGISTDNLQTLQLATEATGTSIDRLTVGITRMQTAIASGTARGKDLMTNLGLTPDDLNNNYAILEKLSTKINELGVGSAAAGRLMASAFGPRALNLEEPIARLDEFNAALNQMGLRLSGDTVAKLTAAQESLNTFHFALQQTEEVLTALLAPAIEAIGNLLTQAVAHFGGAANASTDFKTRSKEMSIAVIEDLNSIIQGIIQFGVEMLKTVASAIQGLGQLQTSIAGIQAAIHPLGPSFTELSSGIIKSSESAADSVLQMAIKLKAGGAEIDTAMRGAAAGIVTSNKAADDSNKKTGDSYLANSAAATKAAAEAKKAATERLAAEQATATGIAKVQIDELNNQKVAIEDEYKNYQIGYGQQAALLTANAAQRHQVIVTQLNDELAAQQASGVAKQAAEIKTNAALQAEQIRYAGEVQKIRQQQSQEEEKADEADEAADLAYQQAKITNQVNIGGQRLTLIKAQLKDERDTNQITYDQEQSLLSTAMAQQYEIERNALQERLALLDPYAANYKAEYEKLQGDITAIDLKYQTQRQEQQTTADDRYLTEVHDVMNQVKDAFGSAWDTVINDAIAGSSKNESVWKKMLNDLIKMAEQWAIQISKILVESLLFGTSGGPGSTASGGGGGLAALLGIGGQGLLGKLFGLGGGAGAVGAGAGAGAAATGTGAASGGFGVFSTAVDKFSGDTTSFKDSTGAFGTSTNLIGDASTAIGDSFSTFSDSVGSIGDDVTKFGGSADSFTGAIPGFTAGAGSFNSGASLFSGAIPSMTDSFSGITSFFSGGSSSPFGGDLTDAFGAQGSVVDGLMQGGFSSSGPEVTSTFGGAFGGILAPVKSIFGSAFSGIQSLVQTVFGGAIHGIQSIFQTVFGGAISGIESVVKTVFGGAFQGAEKIIGTVFGGAFNSIKDLLGSIFGDIFGTIFGAIGSALSNLGAAIGFGPGGSLLSSLGSAFGKGGAGLGALAGAGVGTGIEELAKKLGLGDIPSGFLGGAGAIGVGFALGGPWGAAIAGGIYALENIIPLLFGGGRPKMDATKDIAKLAGNADPVLKLLGTGAQKLATAGVPISSPEAARAFGPYFASAVALEDVIRWGRVDSSVSKVDATTLAAVLHEQGNIGQAGTATTDAVSGAWSTFSKANAGNMESVFESILGKDHTQSIASLLGITSFQSGGMTSGAGLAYLHGGEMVLPTDVTAALINVIGHAGMVGGTSIPSFQEGGYVADLSGPIDPASAALASGITSVFQAIGPQLTKDITDAIDKGTSKIGTVLSKAFLESRDGMSKSLVQAFTDAGPDIAKALVTAIQSATGPTTASPNQSTANRPASFQGGGIAPGTGMAMLHGGEMVLPADVTAELLDVIDQLGGGGVSGLSTQVAPMIAKAISDAFTTAEPDIAKTLVQAFTDSQKGITAIINQAFSQATPAITKAFETGLIAALQMAGKGKLGTAQGGGISAGGLTFLHPEEMVLPANISRSVQAAASNGAMGSMGGSQRPTHVTFNITTPDADATARWISENKRTIADAVMGSQRTFRGLGRDY